MPLVLLGSGYAIYAAVIFASIPHIVPLKTIGTAYGMLFSSLNLGLALGAGAVGLLFDYFGSYYSCSVFFCLTAVLCIVTALGLLIADRRLNGHLNSKAQP